MNIWEVIIYEGNGIWNWKANNKDSDCKIPIFGKTFSSEEETITDWKKYADLHSIKNCKIKKESKEEYDG